MLHNAALSLYQLSQHYSYKSKFGDTKAHQNFLLTTMILTEHVEK